MLRLPTCGIYPPKNKQVMTKTKLFHILKRINCWLVVSTPLKNMRVSWDHYSQYMESQTNHVPNRQPELYSPGLTSDSNPPCSPGIRRDSTGTSCPRTFRRWREGWRRRPVDPLGRSTNTSGISRRSTRS